MMFERLSELEKAHDKVRDLFIEEIKDSEKSKKIGSIAISLFDIAHQLNIIKLLMIDKES